MNTLWKGIMHLNAKVFCLCMVMICVALIIYCGFQINTPPTPIQDGAGKTPELSPAWEITLLDFVSNQLASTSLIIPVDPFRPTIEAIFTNATERAAFIAALKKAQEDAAGMTADTDAKKTDPFAHLRKKADVPGQSLSPDGKPMITPVLTYMGFIKRPDGTSAAMFYDSANKTTIFYDQGNDVHGVNIVDASLQSATLRMDDGSTRDLKIGENVTLAPEEIKEAPPPPAEAKDAAKDAAKLTPEQREALKAKRIAERAKNKVPVGQKKKP